MISHLKSSFPKVPNLALSTIVTSNILDYIWEYLQLYSSVYLYKKLLDCTKFIYLILEIKKPGFEELIFVIFSYLATFRILKTMIFIDNIDMAGQLELYLQNWFFSRL